MTRPKILLWMRVFVASETCLPSRCLATIGGIHIQTHRLLGRIYEVRVETGSVAMMYITSLIEIGSGIQNLMGGDTQRHRQDGDRIGLF
jgi:hypothetical protein